MLRKSKIYLLLLFTTTCIFVLQLYQFYNNYWSYKTKIKESLYDDDRSTPVNFDEIIAEQRRIISADLNYNNSFNKFIMERGGTPFRSVVLSTWRSGSTFTGHLLNAHPANFHVVEPLRVFGNRQIREPPLANEAARVLESIFKCNYSHFGTEKNPLTFPVNKYLWSQCQSHPTLCRNDRFVSRICQLFPYQTMKIVSLRLGAMEKFLKQNDLGIKLLFLVRDPRGVLRSRKDHNWCRRITDCIDPATLCSDMVENYKSAVRFSKLYRKDFRVIRYEDMSLEPYKYAQYLYQFFGLDFHRRVREFLDTHTKTNKDGFFETYRDSKTAPFHWREDLTYEEVDKIQQSCKLVFKLWGYNLALNSSHQKTFDPVGDFFLKDYIPDAS